MPGGNDATRLRRKLLMGHYLVDSWDCAAHTAAQSRYSPSGLCSCPPPVPDTHQRGFEHREDVCAQFEDSPCHPGYEARELANRRQRYLRDAHDRARLEDGPYYRQSAVVRTRPCRFCGASSQITTYDRIYPGPGHDDTPICGVLECQECGHKEML
mgnify:CR=1 FL=1